MTVREVWEDVKPGSIVAFSGSYREALKLQDRDQVADLADGAILKITELLILDDEYQGQFFTCNKCHECGR